MKKLLLTLAAVCTIAVGYSQKLKDAKKSIKTAQEMLLIQSTGEAIKNINEAKKTIDALASDEKNTKDPEYWYTKATLYSLMQEVPDFASSNPFQTSSEAIDKAIQLDMKKTLKFEGASNLIINNGFYHFNNGVNQMNGNQYSEAAKSFEDAYRYLNVDNGSAFKEVKQVDTIKAKALYMGGVSAYYGGDYGSAAKYLDMAAKNPVTAKESNVYLNLANTYGKLNQRDKQLATIEAGKKLFPEDANIFAAEINYYIDGGETDKVITKLEDQIKSSPNRDDYHYNLGLTYMELVKRNSGKDGELENLLKAKESFKNAARINSGNVNYKYYQGTAAFNAAALVNDKIMNTKDMSKMSELAKERDAYFNESIPLFAEVNTYYKGQDKSKLATSDMAKWEQALRALSRMYAEMDKTAEYEAIQKDLEKL